MLGGRPLRCPGCGALHPGTERFCDACGLPLVVDRPTELEIAQVKVRPELSRGELVKVAGGRHQAEAEFLQQLLLEEGVPSMVRRSRGFDVPDLLAAGPRDVLVPASGVAVARDVLRQAELQDGEAAGGPAASRILLWLVVGVAVVALIALVGTALQG
jgi:hypothetical protein